MIPYGKQTIEECDIEAVVQALKSDYLTQGPRVAEFEEALANYCGVKYAVAVSNGTAALQAAYFAAGLKAGDEFITAPLTFVATANAGLWLGAKPVFVDVESDTGNIDPDKIETAINSKTKVIAPIDYTGRPVDFDRINYLAKKHDLVVVEDACQALGAEYQNKKVGSLSDLTVFSFHPVKTITTGEGGAILTNNEQYYKKMKMFVSHGITKENFVSPSANEWYVEMQLLGQNYRLTDMQCALGISQLKKIEKFLQRRRELVQKYNKAFENNKNIITPSPDQENSKSAWHLYTIRLIKDKKGSRDTLFKQLLENGIRAQVHHILSYSYPYYRELGYQKGLCPVAEQFFDTVLSLPLYPNLTDEQCQYVADMVNRLSV